jgi:hypothetical protein
MYWGCYRFKGNGNFAAFQFFYACSETYGKLLPRDVPKAGRDGLTYDRNTAPWGAGLASQRTVNTNSFKATYLAEISPPLTVRCLEVARYATDIACASATL